MIRVVMEKNCFVILLAVYLLLQITFADGYAIFGYLPEYRHAFLDEDHHERLDAICDTVTHLILFSLEVSPNGMVTALDRFPNEQRMKQLRQVCSSKQVKLMLCFGGFARSNGFSEVVKSVDLTDQFARNLKTFYEKHDLDGIDWNWEYPSSLEEFVGLSKLINKTRKILPKSIHSVAYYPDGRQERILSALGFQYVADWFHSMSYDQAGRHSTVQFGIDTIRRYLSAGLPREKMTLGIPMYARHVKTGEAKTFMETLHSVAKGDTSRLIETDEIEGWYLNSPKTIAKKIALTVEEGIGGLMIWECGQDSEGMLLHKAIADETQTCKIEL